MSDHHVALTATAYGDSASRFAEAVGTTISSAFEADADQSALEVFAELAGHASGPVVDAGCGTGRVARFLADRGHTVIGVDIASGMIDAARTAHADLRFEVAELTDLPVESSTLAGVVYWYSIITTPPDGLGSIWAELDRTLAADGVALVAFQCGSGESDLRPNAFGTSTDLTLFRHDIDHVCQGLESASLDVHAVTRRAPCLPHESSDQAFIVAARASRPATTATNRRTH